MEHIILSLVLFSASLGIIYMKSRSLTPRPIPVETKKRH